MMQLSRTFGQDDVFSYEAVNDELTDSTCGTKDLKLLQVAAVKAVREGKEPWLVLPNPTTKDIDDRNTDSNCNHYTDTQTEYCPRYKSLLRPSDAPLITFYVYRAQNSDDYGPSNTNVGSLGGVLWYLHNEIVPYCSSDSHRKFGISRILRYKITMRATLRMQQNNMTFGDRTAYDSGKNTGGWYGPGTQQQAYENYGYVVGCNILGDGPFPLCPSKAGTLEHFCPISYGPDAAWYSLPGACPSKDHKSETLLCKIQQPGGFCKGIPSGKGNCTWTYEKAGEINIDELTGISLRFKSHEEFCQQDCLEYDKFRTHKGRCGINFWDDYKNASRSHWRMQMLDDAFKNKYPNMSSDAEMPPPKCNFDKAKYFSFPNVWDW